jgi:DNA mismatch repair ATPase MutS
MVYGVWCMVYVLINPPTHPLPLNEHTLRHTTYDIRHTTYSARDETAQCVHNLESHLRDVRKQLGVNDLNYWGTNKDRYQIEVPMAHANKVPRDWTSKSQKKTHRRYWHPTVPSGTNLIYLISHISYLISHISYLISHISYLISNTANPNPKPSPHPIP